MPRQGRSSAARWCMRLPRCLASAGGAEGSRAVADEMGGGEDYYDGIAEAAGVAVPQSC